MKQQQQQQKLQYNYKIATTIQSNNYLVNTSHLNNNASLGNLAEFAIKNVTNSDCSDLLNFANTYKPIHGYLSAALCLFGIPSNILNIIVLTRPNLISSPTNLILTSLAISDLLTMLSYLPFSIWFYIIHPESSYCKEMIFYPERDTKFWMQYTITHVNISVTVHSISIWLTVYLACFRYAYLQSSSLAIETTYRSIDDNNNNSNQNNKKFRYYFDKFLINFRQYNSCLVWIILICIFCLIFCSPTYFIYYVDKLNVSNNSNSTVYVYLLKDTQLNLVTNGFIFNLTFYTQAIFAKLIPCILLVTFSLLLIRSLVIINRNNRKLKQLQIPLLNKPSTTVAAVTTRKSLNNENDDENRKKKTKLHKGSVFLSIPSSRSMSNLLNNNCNTTQQKSKSITPSLSAAPAPRAASSTASLQLNNLLIAKKRSRNRTKEHLRTTLMLIIVCVLFLITELPQSILIFLSIILKEQDFYENVYMPLGDIMDIIALLNNSINFILYCIMSRAFRDTFYGLIMNIVNKVNFCKKTDNNRNNTRRQSSLNLRNRGSIINNNVNNS